MEKPGIQTTERCRPKRTRSPPSWRMPQWTHISQRYLDIRNGRESASEILSDNACSLYDRHIPTHIHSHWTLHTQIITYVTLDYVTFLYVPFHCAHTHTDIDTYKHTYKEKTNMDTSTDTNRPNRLDRRQRLHELQTAKKSKGFIPYTPYIHYHTMHNKLTYKPHPTVPPHGIL